MSEHFIKSDADIDGWDALIARKVANVAQCINGGGEVEACLFAVIGSAVNESREQALEEAAARIEGGRFLHDDAPDARLARSAAKAIRALAQKEGKRD